MSNAVTTRGSLVLAEPTRSDDLAEQVHEAGNRVLAVVSEMHEPDEVYAVLNQWAAYTAATEKLRKRGTNREQVVARMCEFRLGEIAPVAGWPQDIAPHERKRCEMYAANPELFHLACSFFTNDFAAGPMRVKNYITARLALRSGQYINQQQWRIIEMLDDQGALTNLEALELQATRARNIREVTVESDDAEYVARANRERDCWHAPTVEEHKKKYGTTKASTCYAALRRLQIIASQIDHQGDPTIAMYRLKLERALVDAESWLSEVMARQTW